MTESVKPSAIGRVRGERPSERPDWSGTASINEPRRFVVITPHGEVRAVMAITPALAINLVSPGNFNGCCVTEGKVAKCLGKCNRCGNPIWDGDRHEVRRKAGAKPKTWTHLRICEDCR